MNISNKNRKESGVGLIEILVVLVVLVIGWAAIAALQGTLISGSSASKARNIALELAREKTEELRSTIEKGQYDNTLVTGAVSGEEVINATYTRSWTLGDVELGTGTKVDHLKQLVMTVSWKNNENIDENVVLNSMIAFADPMRSTSLVTGGSDDAGRLAPPNSESGYEGPGKVVGDITPVKDWDGNPDTTDDNVYTGVDENGNPVVFQGIPLAGKFTDGLTAYGGKLLTISGTVYYLEGNDPYVRATAPSFCSSSFRSPSECGTDGFTIKGSDITCAKYICFVGGDCSNGGDDCQDGWEDLPDLNGGWYGKVGDFFPEIKTSYPTVCMSDPLGQSTDQQHDPNTTGISIGIPARLFVTKRVFDGSDTGFSREGINKSFEGYDTFISNPTDTLCGEFIKEIRKINTRNEARTPPYPEIPILADSSLDAEFREMGIADFEIIRCLAEDDTNDVLPSTGFDPTTPPNFVPNDCQPLPGIGVGVGVGVVLP